jgi:hypothetical protein
VEIPPLFPAVFLLVELLLFFLGRPGCLSELVKPLFPNVKEVYELYGKVKLAHLKSNLERPLEELETITITAISDAMSALKLRRIKKGYSYDALKAYLYGTAHRLFLEEKRRESVCKDPSLLINFLKTRKSKLVQRLEELSVEWSV